MGTNLFSDYCLQPSLNECKIGATGAKMISKSLQQDNIVNELW